MKKVSKILIVDDDLITCFLQKRTLEILGVAKEVDFVHDGLQAMEYLNGCCCKKITSSENCPSLIFLDINMPVMNGFEFLEKLEALPEKQIKNIYVVMLTSSINPKDAQEAAKYANVLKGYLTKPLTEESINQIMLSIAS